MLLKEMEGLRQLEAREKRQKGFQEGGAGRKKRGWGLF